MGSGCPPKFASAGSNPLPGGGSALDCHQCSLLTGQLAINRLNGGGSSGGDESSVEGGGNNSGGDVSGGHKQVPGIVRMSPMVGLGRIFDG